VYAADIIDRRRSALPLVAMGALLGAIPDLDLLLPRYHRSITHSITAVVFVLIIAAAVTGRVNQQARWRVAIISACAYASHLLLDWLGSDALPPYGLQLFWPFDPRFFISGWNLFAETERRSPLPGPTMIQNFWAAAQEIAIMAPVAAGLWLIRVKALARLPAEMPRRDQAPQ
jgi:inner membrane protein